MPSYYRNEYLFSEIYLEEITRQVKSSDVMSSMHVLAEYRKFADKQYLKAWKESYVHNVLSALGFQTQSANDHLSYLFPLGSTEKPVSVCYTVIPDESLENTTMGRNWAEKIIRSLREQEMSWGLLTNGRQWRIYHLDDPTPYETYLEIDLEAILDDKAEDAFQIFHTFLKAENFTPQEDGNCQFDCFKKESQDKIDYIEKELINALKQREEGGKGVLSDICMGYVDEFRRSPWPHGRGAGGEGDLDDEAFRKKIYHGAMLYMFRLLFLFYADARQLMNDDNHRLLESVEQDCQRQRANEFSDGKSYSLWERLEQIFVDIDQTYNGGLFSPQESEFTRFIEDTRISDEHLINVIYNLTTYREKSGEEKSISYRDMSVRHLGTLYEGLLEHNLFIAKEDTEVKVAKGKVQFIPESQGGKLVAGRYLKAGTVYFAGDPSERKSTGSYYTPEYIVDYIVRNTVGEKLKELIESFLADEKANREAHQQAVDEDERQSLAALIEENALSFIREKVLQLSVLDPAMGSGHFLVNATNIIANAITEIINEPEIEGTLASGTAHWRRWVVENCIYGVDINPLAVELAKLSLWILSMAKEQPLSFLNHHLKCGNSLVGARLEEIGNFPLSTAKKESRQLTLFERDPDFKAAVEEAIFKSILITTKGSTTLEDVKEKKAWLDEIEHVLSKYKDICNVHTSLFFGNNVNEELYDQMVENKNFILARELDKPNQYFHWELEYPQILISKQGFTCIVCNPPYDTFRENNFYSREAASGTGNLFSHFIVNSVRINSLHGNIGYVVPLSFSCGNSFESIRKYIYSSYQFLQASHYSIRPAKLFPNVDQRITIFISINKGKYSECDVYSSRLWRWHIGNEERVVKFPNLGHVGRIISGIIPKTAGQIGASIYNKILIQPDEIQSLLGDSDISGYFHLVARYWVKAYDFIPYFIREGETIPTRSTKLKELRFKSHIDRDLFILLVNSSLFYYWWIARGDEFDVFTSDVLSFKFFNEKVLDQRFFISSLAKELMIDYKKNAAIKTAFAGGKEIQYEEFYPRKSINTIRKIDFLLYSTYSLTKEEQDFLSAYDMVLASEINGGV